ncbi:DUF7576 family protein [Haladaptatus sp.]|uniref:DUF7576 family protein n=1 Tax=Haladaptatus sp. TaxID=1973141 RepID=UPI003C56772C
MIERNKAVGDQQICAVCGDAIDIEAWHPVLADTDSNGTLRLYPFCTPACRNEWNRHRNDR